jgi:pimeloyl-ACP methyl ester carboxylesterase
MELPETRYARSGDVSVAYQAFGEGPPDLIWVSGVISNVEYQWAEPRFAGFLRRMGSFARVIRFDKRGTGLSDGVGGMPTLEQRMDDVRAVLDDAGSERAIVLGAVEGSPIAILFAATYPERTLALVLYGSYVKTVWSPDFPWAPRFEDWMKATDEAARGWGTRAYCDETVAKLAPTADEGFRRFWSAYMRFGASPAAAAALMRMNMQIDVREILATIRVPTLILHRRNDPVVDVNQSRYMAERIPAARYVELEGVDQVPFVGNAEAVLREVEDFVKGVRDSAEPDRMLATVFFTDIVDSKLSRHFRRPGPRRRVRVRGGRCERRARTGAASRPSHRRMRGRKRRRDRDRGPYRRARRRGGRGRRGCRLADGQGPRRRIAPRVQRARRGRAEGRAGRMAALHGRAVNRT